MRMTSYYCPTLRETPADAASASQGILLRAGYLRRVSANQFSFLPLAHRALSKIEKIFRQEMDRIGGFEISLPAIPVNGSARGESQGQEQVKELAHKDIHSYKQLPLLLYDFQTRSNREPAFQSTPAGERAYRYMDSYSMDTSLEGLDRQYRAHFRAYLNIFSRCNLPVKAINSGAGAPGGTLEDEFVYLIDAGEDTLIRCDQCGYSANQRQARAQKPVAAQGDMLPVKKVATPGVKTIEALAEFLGIPESGTAKAVFLMAGVIENDQPVSRLVHAIVRGDMELSESKLARLIGAFSLRPAQEDEIIASGAVPGYASPVGLKDALVVVDDLIPRSPNLVAGANEEGYHLMNVNFGRDFQTEWVADIVSVQAGDLCLNCGHPLGAENCLSLGKLTRPGEGNQQAARCVYQDENGVNKPVIMGSYSLEYGRLLECLADSHQDENGLVLPVTVAPFQVHLVVLVGKDSEKCKAIAEELYAQLRAGGIEVLFDDREESPGVKFADADLIGLPLRLTVSSRALQSGGVELVTRDKARREVVPLDGIVPQIKSLISAMESKVDEEVTVAGEDRQA